MDKFSPYIDIIHPFRFRDIVNKNKDAKSLKPSFYNILFATLVTLMFSVFQSSVAKEAVEANFPADPKQAEAAQQVLQLLAQTLSPVFIILNFIVAIVFFYAMQYLLYSIIKILGGRGNFNSQAYLVSVLYTSFVVVSILLSLILVIFYSARSPDIFIGVLSFIILAYTFYLFYSIIKMTYNTSVIVTIVSLLLFAILFFILTMAVDRILMRLLFLPA